MTRTNYQVPLRLTIHATTQYPQAFLYPDVILSVQSNTIIACGAHLPQYAENPLNSPNGPSDFKIDAAQSTTPLYGIFPEIGSGFCAIKRDLIKSNGIENAAAVKPCDDDIKRVKKQRTETIWISIFFETQHAYTIPVNRNNNHLQQQETNQSGL